MRLQQVDWVLTATCAHFGISEKVLLSTSRFPTSVRARNIAMAVTRDLFPYLSYPEIGHDFGNRGHSTVMSACKLVHRMIEENERWRTDWDAVRERVIQITPEEWRQKS